MSNKNHPATLAQLTEVLPDKGGVYVYWCKKQDFSSDVLRTLVSLFVKVAAAQLEKVVSGRGV